MISIAFRCDISGCGSFYEHRHASTVEDAKERAATRFGWAFRKGRDICRDHNHPEVFGEVAHA